MYKQIPKFYHLARENRRLILQEICAFQNHNKLQKGKNDLRMMRNAALTRKIENEIKEIGYLIEKESRFGNSINFASLSTKISNNLSLFLENHEEIEIFLTFPNFLQYLKILEKVKVSAKARKSDEFLNFILKSFNHYFSQGQINEFNEWVFAVNLAFSQFPNKKSPKNLKKEYVLNFLSNTQKLLEKKPETMMETENIKIFLEFIIIINEEIPKEIAEKIFNLLLKKEEKYDFLLLKWEILGAPPENELKEMGRIIKAEGKIEKILEFTKKFIKMMGLQSNHSLNSAEFTYLLIKNMEKMMKTTDLIEKFTILEGFDLILALKPLFSIKPDVFQSFLANIFRISQGSKAVDLELDQQCSNWLTFPNKAEISKEIIWNIPQFNINLLLFLGFLQNQGLLKLGKFECLLHFCLKSRFLREFKENSDFLEIFRYLTKGLSEKKIPFFLELFQDFIEEELKRLLQRGDYQDFLWFLLGIVPKNSMVFAENSVFVIKIDELLFSLIGLVDLKEHKTGIEGLTAVKSFKICGFHRKLLAIVEEKFETLDFVDKIHYLYLFSKIFSQIHYLQSFDEVMTQINEQNLEKIQNLFDFYKVFHLLCYSGMGSDFVSIKAKIAIQKFSLLAQRLSRSSKNNEMFKRFYGLFQIFHLVYPGFSLEFLDLLKVTMTSAESIQKSVNKGKFQASFAESLLKVYPGLELKENFFLFGTQFECDIWIKNFSILIELCGPSHFFPNENYELNEKFQAILASKQRVLKAKKTVIVPYFEWNDINEKNRLQYIKSNVFP